MHIYIKLLEKYSNLHPCEKKELTYGILAGITATGVIAGGIVSNNLNSDSLAHNLNLGIMGINFLMTFASIHKWEYYHQLADKLESREKGELEKFLESHPQ